MTPEQIADRRRRTIERLLTPVKRWSPERKHDLLIAVRAGLITADEVLTAHGIKADELKRLNDAYERDGIDGLRAAPYRPKARAA